MPENRFTHEVRFTIGEAFPASDPVARWMTVCCLATNDLLFVNEQLLPRLEGDAPAWENIYLARLAASHLYEAAKFLIESEARYGADLTPFVDRLSEDAKEHYQTVKGVGPGGGTQFAAQLERLRNQFFHYAELIRGAPQYEQLTRALEEHADTESAIRIGRRFGDFRAEFADEVAAALAYDQSEGIEDFMSTFAETIAALWQLVYAALEQYLLDRGKVAA